MSVPLSPSPTFCANNPTTQSTTQVVGFGGQAPPCALVHAPLSALPVAFPVARFEQAVACMRQFSDLIDKVAADEDYLTKTLKQVRFLLGLFYG